MAGFLSGGASDIAYQGVLNNGNMTTIKHFTMLALAVLVDCFEGWLIII